MDDSPGKEKLLKPTRIGEKGRKDSPLPFALNQKTVGSPEKACSYRMMKKPRFSRRNVHRDVINTLFDQKTWDAHPLEAS
jgi:hypothetical protein